MNKTSVAVRDGTFTAFDFQPGRVYALGLTYSDHIQETGERAGTPVVFEKRCQVLPTGQSSVAAPSAQALEQTIRELDPALAHWLGDSFPTLPVLMDYEVELGLVVLEDVALDSLDDPAFAPAIGWFVANDLTARSVQTLSEGAPNKLDFWAASKSFPDFLPASDKIWRPAKAQLDTVPELTLQTSVNGRVRQSASTRLLVYSPRQMLQIAAQFAPDKMLLRHDLVLTGTPAGVALSVPAWKRRLAALLPRRWRIRAALRSNLDNPRFLRPGDELSFSADWLGMRTVRISSPKFALLNTGVLMKPCTIIMPLPSHDFDPTEAALTWKILRDAGHRIDFATPDGKRAYADPMMISGQGLDPWAWVPGLNRLRLMGLLLRADRFGRQAYQELEMDSQFLCPKRYDALRVSDYDALVLSGGHAQGMKPYLESKTLQAFVAEFFDTLDTQGQHKPIAAVCHGVLLAARSMSKKTGRSVLHGRKTTALTWKLERSAWHLGKYFVRFWDPDYYRTYRESAGESVGYWGVEQEIKRALASASDFVDVPSDAPHHFQKTSGMARDRLHDDRPAWVVQDGNYLSARWPGDVHSFAQQFVRLLARS